MPADQPAPLPVACPYCQGSRLLVRHLPAADRARRAGVSVAEPCPHLLGVAWFLWLALDESYSGHWASPGLGLTKSEVIRLASLPGDVDLARTGQPWQRVRVRADPGIVGAEMAVNAVFTPEPGLLIEAHRGIHERDRAHLAAMLGSDCERFAVAEGQAQRVGCRVSATRSQP